VKIVIPINEPNPNGFAHGIEAEQIYAIEEWLASEVEVAGETVLVATATSDGVYEFHIYTKNANAVTEQLRSLVNRTTTHSIQFAVQLDPDWQVYKQLTG
jgi:hypothetical protein